MALRVEEHRHQILAEFRASALADQGRDDRRREAFLEQPFLRAEIAHDQRGIDAGIERNLAQADAVIALAAEANRRSLENRLPRRARIARPVAGLYALL